MLNLIIYFFKWDEIKFNEQKKNIVKVFNLNSLMNFYVSLIVNTCDCAS